MERKGGDPPIEQLKSKADQNKDRKTDDLFGKRPMAGPKEEARRRGKSVRSGMAHIRTFLLGYLFF